VANTSEYVFRGLTQTWAHPAIQGGADYAAADGFAAGFWASGISERSYPGAAMELDLYASDGRTFGNGWSWRAGLYGYVYPAAISTTQIRACHPVRSTRSRPTSHWAGDGSR
jgi:uncharacterized protein (TIGR02001 family)